MSPALQKPQFRRLCFSKYILSVLQIQMSTFGGGKCRQLVSVQRGVFNLKEKHLFSGVTTGEELHGDSSNF